MQGGRKKKVLGLSRVAWYLRSEATEHVRIDFGSTLSVRGGPAEQVVKGRGGEPVYTSSHPPLVCDWIRPLVV